MFANVKSPNGKPSPVHVIFASVNRSFDYKIDKEETTSNGAKLKASAIFQKLYTKNNNGHHMDEKCLIREINNAQEDIRSRHFLGELDHPGDIDDSNRIATVELNNASHLITKLEVDKDYVVGEFETLTTPRGMILHSLLTDKIKTGVSIRAITEQDIVYDRDSYQTVHDFKLICYDVVHNPAFNDAYITGLLSSVYRLNPVDVNNLVNKNKPTGELITLSKSDLKALVSSMVTTIVKAMYKKV